MAFQTGLMLKAAFICLQEPYINIYFFSYSSYEIRWSEKGKISEKRVLIAIRKNLLIKVITESHSDLINHSYFLAIDV